MSKGPKKPKDSKESEKGQPTEQRSTGSGAPGHSPGDEKDS
jgi:hypothetical protein